MRRFTPKQLLNRTERKNVKTLAFRTCLIVLVLALIWRNRYTLALLREMLGSSASDNKGEGWESRAGSLDRAARSLRLRHNLLLPCRAVVIANAKEKRRCESG